MNTLYSNKNREIVNMMIEKENTFKHQNEYVYDTISDVSLFKYSPSFEMEYCIFDLIKDKNEVQKYDPLSILVKSKNLLPELWKIVSDYADIEDKIVTPTNPEIEERFVDTTLIVINKMDDHIWKERYNTHYKYKTDLKVTFISTDKQINNIMKDNFKKANKHDAIIVRSDIWSKMATDEKGYKGYSPNVEFRFKRAIFAVRPNNNVKESNLYCPYANFTWCDNSEKINDPHQWGEWNHHLPVSSRKVLPWDKYYYSDHLEDSLTVNVKQSDSFNRIRNLKKESYGISSDRYTNYTVPELILNKIKQEPYTTILCVHGSDTSEEGVRITEKSFKKFPGGKKIKFKTIKKNTRFYWRKVLLNEIQVINVSENELYRKDLNFEFFTEVIYIDNSSGHVNVDFIEKCCPFKRDNHGRDFNVTIIKNPHFFSNNKISDIKHYIKRLIWIQLGVIVYEEE